MRMISNETETQLIYKCSKKNESQRESSIASENEVNINVEDSARCSNRIRVKMVAEINEKSSVGEDIAEINNNQCTRKREITGVDSCNPKRSRIFEEVEILDRPKGNKSTIQKENEVSRSYTDITGIPNQEVKNSTIKIKTESFTNGYIDILASSSSYFNNADIKPAVKVEKVEANSTSRESCQFGIRCYRRNVQHRLEEAHPGDSDYQMPRYPTPPLGTPDCPYGDLCYRRNPIHFTEYSHPPETDFEKNYKRQHLRRQQENSRDVSELEDEYDFQEPYINDEELDSDYEPNSDDDDYDSCDRAEE